MQLFNSWDAGMLFSSRNLGAMGNGMERRSRPEILYQKLTVDIKVFEVCFWGPSTVSGGGPGCLGS